MGRLAIELDLSHRRVLVVGFGQVGRRKVQALLDTGAEIVVIDPHVFSDAPPGVTLACEPYQAQHLEGVSLALAAATPEVNQRVLDDAQRLGIWVNMASESGRGDFYLPASWRDGPITLSVSTDGISPALAAALRDKAAQALGTAAARLANVLADLRTELLATINDPLERRRIMSSWADPIWLKLAETDPPELLREQLRACLADCSRNPDK